MSQNKAHVDDGGNNVQKQGPGDMLMDQKKLYNITTAGAGTIPAEAVLSGIINRTGPAGGFADTFPSAASLLAAEPSLNRGDAFEFLYINGVAQAMTGAAFAGSGDTVVNVATAASLVRRIMCTVLGDGQATSFQGTTTTGQATIQALNIKDVRNVRVGQFVSGTGVAAASYVTGVNVNTGVVTVSVVATGTGTAGILSQPAVEYRGLYSATA